MRKEVADWIAAELKRHELIEAKWKPMDGGRIKEYPMWVFQQKIDKAAELDLTGPEMDKMEGEKARRLEAAGMHGDPDAWSSKLFPIGLKLPGTMLTVIGGGKNRISKIGMRGVEFKCDCGQKCAFKYSRVYQDLVYSCGCKPRPRNLAKDVSGQMFGDPPRLYANSYTTNVGWDCTCAECGEHEIVRHTGKLEQQANEPCPNKPVVPDEGYFSVKIECMTGAVTETLWTRVKADSAGQAEGKVRSALKIKAV